MSASVQSAFGIVSLFSLAWLLSERRGEVRLSVPIISFLLQLGLALLFIKAPVSQFIFSAVNTLVIGLEQATRQGTGFVFGYLGGDALPFQAAGSGSSFILAFQALPLIIFLSALISLLNYWQILPRIIHLFARLLNVALPMSGATAFASVANIFVGMIESPLFIKPYLEKLSRSDLFILMTVGMATIAGTVMVIYVGFLSTVLDNAAGHLLTASVISVPAAIGISSIMVPSKIAATEKHHTLDSHSAAFESHDSAIDALVSGTQQGLQLCLQIAALLIVFVALIALLNSALVAILPSSTGIKLDLQTLLGYAMAPLAWLIGIPWSEALAAGKLLGVKTILNEFIALRQLGEIGLETLAPRSITIMSYALSGFANIGSLGILIGGLTAMAPNRRAEIIQLAPRAIISGTFATLLTGAVIGLIY